MKFEKLAKLLKLNFAGTIILRDNTEVIVDGSVEVGASVMVMLPDVDEPVTLPDGEYTLEDGSLMVVSDGLIAELKDEVVEDPTEIPEEAPVEEPMAEDEVAPIEEVAADVIEEVTVAVAEIVEEETPVDEVVAITVEETIAALTTRVEELEKQSKSSEEMSEEFSALKEKIETADGTLKLSKKKVVVELSAAQKKRNLIKGIQA